jgi:hypothetical protein
VATEVSLAAARKQCIFENINNENGEISKIFESLKSLKWRKPVCLHLIMKAGQHALAKSWLQYRTSVAVMA